MSLIENTRSSSLPGIEQHSVPGLDTTQGRLQGRGVVVIKPDTIKEPSTSPLRDSQPKPLERRSVSQEKPGYSLARMARYGGVDTRDQLVSKAGRPKNDISFGMLGTKKMSTGYKAILGGLDRYQETLGPGGRSGSPTERLQALLGDLHDLGNATDRYMTTRGHTRKQEVGEVRLQVQRETRVIEGLLDEIGKGAPLPDSMTLQEVVEFARQGISLKDMAGLHAKGLSAEEARETIDAHNWKTPLDAETLKTYTDAGFTPDEAFLLERSGLGIAGGQMYREFALAILPETIVLGFRDETLHDPIKMLGSGSVNTVYSANYDIRGGTYEGVFKPLRKPDLTGMHRVETSWVSGVTGVNPFDPQTAMRNVATYDVAKKLGFNVVPHTEIGIRKNGEEPPQLGLVMGKAQGVPASDCGPLYFLHGDVRREITKLQLLDHLTGQGDRHHHNYFIMRDETGKVVVTGIDNDQCFGKDLHDPNGIAQDHAKEHDGFRGTKMPPVIDTEMAKAFRDMTPESLEATLAGKLTPQEIAAAKDRLEGIKAHIDALEKDGKIISPNDWGERWVGEALNSSNSYAGRDYQDSMINMFI